MTIDMAFDALTMVMLVATVFLTYRNWRDQRTHHRLIDMRMLFMALWGSGTYEFIHTGKGWHGIGHRSDGDVIEVPWSGK